MTESGLWKLKPLQVEGIEEPIEVVEAITFGRDPGNSIVLGEERFPHVSGHHARVFIRDEKLWVEDLDSKNGTFVNGNQVKQQPLNIGDSLQLGPLGPRFAVVSTVGAVAETEVGIVLSATETHAPRSRRRLGGKKPDLSRTTILQVKRALGIPEEAHVSDLLHTRARRHNLKLLAILLVLIVGSTVGVVLYMEREEGRSVELEQLRSALDDAEKEARQESEQRRERVEALESEKERLLARIGQLEQADRSSAGSMDELKLQLTDTIERLELYNPVNLEQGKLKEVARVGKVVVLIERKTSYRNLETGKQIYVSADERPNTDEDGELFEREGTGSGFCVSADGWIISNAHVVNPDEPEPPLRFEEEFYFPESKLEVVFSGTDKRYSAELISFDSKNNNDVALVKIEPFEGMPHLDEFALDITTPESGSEVFLFGFPLGKFALQSGDRVIASTFKGILSRQVDPFLQVDAGVYPGNSGGPITDSQGRIIGIVTAVQNTPQGSTAAAIGYGLPLERVRAVWPPRNSH